MKGCAVITARNKAKFRVLLGTAWCTVPYTHLLFVISHISATPVKNDPLFCADEICPRSGWWESQLCLKGQYGISKTNKQLKNEMMNSVFAISLFWYLLGCVVAFLILKAWNIHNGRRWSKGQVRQHVTVGMICCYLHCCDRLPQIRAASDGKPRHLVNYMWNCSSESHYHAT